MRIFTLKPICRNKPRLLRRCAQRNSVETTRSVATLRRRCLRCCRMIAPRERRSDNFADVLALRQFVHNCIWGKALERLRGCRFSTLSHDDAGMVAGCSTASHRHHQLRFFCTPEKTKACGQWRFFFRHGVERKPLRADEGINSNSRCKTRAGQSRKTEN